MALTLKEAITATQTTIDVDGSDTLRPGSYRQLADEVILIRTAVPRRVQPGQTPWQRLSVERGIENSEPVEHDAAVAMTTYSSGGGGGGITVDNQDDPPASVTTLISPAAVVSGDEATLRPVIIADADPGAIGAGFLWLKTNGTLNSFQLFARNENNDGWIQAGAASDINSSATREVGGYDDDNGTLIGLTVDSSNGARVATLTAVSADGNETATLQVEKTMTEMRWSGASFFALTMSDAACTLLGLPTADPVIEGALWNDSGTLKVSAG